MNTLGRKDKEPVIILWDKGKLRKFTNFGNRRQVEIEVIGRPGDYYLSMDAGQGRKSLVIPSDMVRVRVGNGTPLSGFFDDFEKFSRK